MEQLVFLSNAFFGGLFVFFTEELIQSAEYSMPTVAVSLAIGILCLFITRRFGNYISLITTGSLVAAFTVAFRGAIVYGGLVTFLPGVDCFAIQTLQPHTYVLFALSGAFAGLTLTVFKKGRVWTHIIGILGIICGVLYHLKVAQGWWSVRPSVAGSLFVGEFLAPSLFAVGLSWLFRIYTQAFSNRYHDNLEIGVGRTILRSNNLASTHHSRLVSSRDSSGDFSVRTAMDSEMGAAGQVDEHTEKSQMKIVIEKERELSQLSDGIPRMPRKMSQREKCADQFYLYLQLGSRVLFIFSGILGYAWQGFVGVLVWR